MTDTPIALARAGLERVIQGLRTKHPDLTAVFSHTDEISARLTARLKDSKLFEGCPEIYPSGKVYFAELHVKALLHQIEILETYRFGKPVPGMGMSTINPSNDSVRVLARSFASATGLTPEDHHDSQGAYCGTDVKGTQTCMVSRPVVGKPLGDAIGAVQEHIESYLSMVGRYRPKEKRVSR